MNATPTTPVATTLDPARTHAILRFAFGVTFAFVVAELLEWVPTFLPPVFAGMLLVNIPVRPPVKVALGFILIVAVSAAIAMLLASVTRGAPAILFGVTALIVFLALHAIARGKPILSPLLLIICVTAIPVVSLDSLSTAGSFAYALARAAVVAVVVTWMAHLIWPRVAPPRAAAKAAPVSDALALRGALLGTAIVAPLMLVFLMFGLTSALPVLIATVMIVASMDFQRGQKQALGLVLGNIAGGFASLILFIVLLINPSLATLTLIVLAAALAFGWRITAGDPMAAIVTVAFNAMLILFSSSLLTDQGTFDVWFTRLTQFLMAGAFAIGMMALLWPRNTGEKLE